MWASSTPSTRHHQQVNYALPAEMGMGMGMGMGMVGLRDVFVVAPAASFHYNEHQQQPINLPLMTATAIDDDMGNRGGGSGGGGGRSNIQFWQTAAQHPPANYLKKPVVNVNIANADHGFVQSVGIGGVTASTSASSMTCQDCGNQAKKDCSHRRCRTCCKSRGFDCATHVKSTWVPAARRRERQLMAGSIGGAAAGSSTSTSGAKKPRLASHNTATTSHTSTSNTTPPRSFDTSSSHQDISFKEGLPGQVRAPAVFKCVRVTAVDEGDDEYAYQAVVKIGGHVFKGFLYDQGVESRSDSFPNLSELHLGGGGNGGSGGGGGRNNGGNNNSNMGNSSASPIIDPSDVYGSSGGGLLPGSTYGNPIN